MSAILEEAVARVDNESANDSWQENWSNNWENQWGWEQSP